MHETSSNDIILNIIVQFVNLVIFFLLFKYFFGDKLAKTLSEREALLKKLADTDQIFQKKLEEAEEKSREIVQQGLDSKEKLITEAGVLAMQKREDILQDAKKRAEIIKQDAEIKSKSLEDELKNNFSNGVKQTSLVVLKKLFGDVKDLQTKYLDDVVEQVVKG